MALKDYPKWVLAHRGKGKEIRHLNGKYYLYLYHNELVDDTRKKVTGKFLGRITENGLIPPVEKITIYQVRLYGLTAFIFSSCNSIINSIIQKFPARHSKLLSLAIFKYFFSNNIDEYNTHYIAIIFPNPIIKDEKETITSEVNRITSMMDHSVKKTLKDLSLDQFKLLIAPIYIVGIKDRWTVAEIDDQRKSIINKYNIKMEINYGQDK